MSENTNVQANNSNTVGSISVGGDISGNIHVGNVGYSSEEVSKLLVQISSTFQAKSFDGKCPYKGLDYFEEEDAELFFGREKLVEELVRRVKESRTVFITGPSGSGKSSLVRAGLIHALKSGAVNGSERWSYATMKPGRDPIRELGRVLASLAGTTNAEDEICQKALSDKTIFLRWCEIALKEGRDKRFVLFLDQFEEVFTQISKEEERVAFLNLLTHAADSENGRVILLFSMRSDFVPNCAVYPELNTTLNRQFIQIGAMQPEELVSAIAQPALRVGLRIDPDLIAQIINDMKGEPGALPLMQFALKDLFDEGQAKGGLIALTLNAYLHHGGIHKSLERHADAAFGKLDKHEQELARSIFSGLIEVGRGTQDTKRTAIFDELIPANASANEVETIVQKLADARLITTDESAGRDTVTISHEKLIDAWPWLKKLVNENRDVIALQNEIAEDAKEWLDNNKDASFLYSGIRLVNASEQLKANKLVLSGMAFEYIQAGRARQQRNKFFLGSSIFAVLTLLIISVIVFKGQASKYQELSEENAKIALDEQNAREDAQTKAKEAQAQAQIALDRQLAAQTVSFFQNHLDLALLLGAETYHLHNTLETRDSLLQVVQQNPNLIKFLPQRADKIYDLAFTADGDRLIIGEVDNSIQVMEIQNLEYSTIKIHDMNITDLPMFFGFDPKTETLIIGYENQSVLISDFNQSATTNKEIDQFSNVTVDIAISANGRVLAQASGNEFSRAINIWEFSNPTNPSPIGAPLVFFGSFRSIALNPDGTILATGNGDGTITLWSISKSGVPTLLGKPFSMEERNDGYSLAFSPDGRVISSGTDSGEINLWDISNPFSIYRITTLTGNSSAVSSVTFRADGNTLASGSIDGSLILWNISEFNKTNLTENSASLPEYIKKSLNEATRETVDPDGIVRILSPDTSYSAYVYNSKLRIESTKCVIGYYCFESEENVNIETMIFSPNNKSLASMDMEGNISLWDISSIPDASLIPFIINPIFSISPNNSTKMLFDSDSEVLILGNKDGTIEMWDIRNPSLHEPVWQSEIGHNSSISTLAFSSDEKFLASGAVDGTVMLWDTAIISKIQPFTRPLTISKNPITTLVFSSDNKNLFGESGAMLFDWNIEIDAWLAYICQRAGRNLTPDEWRTFFGTDKPYQPVCSNLKSFHPNDNPIKVFVTKFDTPAAAPIPNTSCPNWLIFESTLLGNSDIFRLDNSEGTLNAKLYNLSNSSANDKNPALSPNSEWIAFQSNRNGNIELYLSDNEGEQQLRLTNTQSNNTNPNFGSDSQTVAYQSDRNGNWDIFLLNKDTGEEVQFTSDPADDVSPFFSPDINLLTFMSNRSGSWNVYIIDTSTGAEYQMTSFVTDVLYPSWSPNGRQLAFLINTTDTWDLYVVDLRGESFKQISTGGNASNPSWSPEGDRIVYQLTTGDNADIFTYDLTANKEYRLTDYAGSDTNPSWDCSGRYITFTSTRNGNSNIFFAPWSGGEIKNITFSPLDEINPVWSPFIQNGNSSSSFP